MDLVKTIFVLQVSSTTMAVLFNSFLIYLIAKHTKSRIGNYRFVLMAFATFETIYALVVFFGMPTHFMADRSWMVFSHGGFIGETPIAVLGPGLYCGLYEVWVGFMVIHFVYRYIVVCRENWRLKIANHWELKLGITIFWLLFLTYCFLCGLYFCTRERLLPKLAEMVKRQFGIDKPEELGYILLRTRTADGSISAAGVTTILNHYVEVGVSSVIIVFCGVNIWMAISRMQTDGERHREARIQRQMFLTLVIQTAVPLVLCHIPTLLYLTFPFWESEFSLGSLSPIFSLITSINKFIDPLIVMFCIGDYRRAVQKIFCKRTVESVESSSDAQRRNKVEGKATEDVSHITSSSERRATLTNTNTTTTNITHP